MPKLRRSRRPRNHRARAPKRRKWRNLAKFIPEADSDFAHVAGNVFLAYLKRDPASYGVTADDVARIATAVAEFRAALAKSIHKFSRTQRTIMDKDVARAKAEAVVRRYANIIRANPDVSDTRKRLLRLKLRPEKLKKRECPQTPPRLQFLGSGDGVAQEAGEGNGSGVHVIRFSNGNDGGVITASSEIGLVRNARPDGAVRIELYFDMVPAGEPIPNLPGERGWPKYLRSFTRSPIEVEYPIPSEPMLIVYWARWANATGETSRWSQTCVARVEGWTPQRPALPEGAGGTAIEARRIETKFVFIQAPRELPERSESDEQFSMDRALTAAAKMLSCEAA